MSLHGNCGKSGQTNFILCLMLPDGVVLCMQGQYRVFPPLAAIITDRHRGMLTTRPCRPSIGSSAHLSRRALAELSKILGRVFQIGDCTNQCIPNMFYGVAVWPSCRLLHLGDVALVKENKEESCRTILNKTRSWRGVVFRGAPVDLPGTKVPVTTCLRTMRLTVALVRPKRPAIAPCRMPSQASASTSCLIPIGVGRGIIRTISEN